jgi:hypothetical protein
MASSAAARDILRALVVALGVNILMVLLPGFAVGPRTHNVFAHISDTLAAVPGALIERIVVQKEYSAKAFLLAGAELLLLSLLVCAIISWLILRCVATVRDYTSRKNGSGLSSI